MTRKKQPPEVSIVRSSAAEYLTFADRELAEEAVIKQ